MIGQEDTEVQLREKCFFLCGKGPLVFGSVIPKLQLTYNFKKRQLTEKIIVLSDSENSQLGFRKSRNSI